ncbi:MAG: hypothetical protein Q4B26_06720 [Eubacteriales bacterium]|nr:hypothetical protein [Eubacteriales bacterium]
MAVNREYKDRLFKLIVEKIPGFALELYNALNNSSYTEEDGFVFNTLEDVIYLGMRNDVSFVIGSHMVLYEQQSTANPNMPLRTFLYTAELLKNYLEETGKKEYLYGTKLVEIPAPKCYVFYNGHRYKEDIVDLRLSDAFCVPSPGYEWTATVVNIGDGQNKELLTKCMVLGDYAAFVDMIAEGKVQGLSIRASVDAAVECFSKKEGAFGMMVKEHRNRVINSILTEYDEEAVHKVFREQAREEGLAEGREEGRVEGHSEGRIETWSNDIVRIVNNFHVSVEEAIKILDIPSEERSRILERVTKMQNN